MRRFPTGLAIALFAIIGLAIVTWKVPLWPSNEGPSSVARLQHCPTHILAQLTIHYDKPPLYLEQYTMRDDNGSSTYEYVVRSYAGKEITVKAPPHATYDVSFFFGKLITDDGAWEVQDRPPVGNTTVHYTVSTRRDEMCHVDAHSATFTDPQYWAKTKLREYEIHLSPTGPMPTIFGGEGIVFRDPHYLEIVGEFRNFGPQAFRSAVATARAELSK
jgi:hypothetical protein